MKLLTKDVPSVSEGKTTPDFGRGWSDSKVCQDKLSLFEINCLEGKMTFGDPFEDSGVVVARTRAYSECSSPKKMVKQ